MAALRPACSLGRHARRTAGLLQAVQAIDGIASDPSYAPHLGFHDTVSCFAALSKSRKFVGYPSSQSLHPGPEIHLIVLGSVTKVLMC
jgi:hypothetical protein